MALLLLCVISYYYSNDNGDRLFTSEHHIVFKPDTIIQSLGANKNDVFSLGSANIWQEEPEPYPYLVSWDQSEYLKIVDAVHQYIWNESISGWRLEYMSFNLPCESANVGLQTAHFNFYKTKISPSGILEINHQVDIYPGRTLISAWEWVGKGHFSILDIDPTRIAVSAKDAILIAERNGGATNHISDDGECSISVLSSPGFVSSHWDIRYKPSFFKISIDAKTGEIIK